jgi:hypothetical protein
MARPVELKSGHHLALVWRHATRDITKNLPPHEAEAELARLIGSDLLDAHLFTPFQTAQLECQPDGTARLRVKSTDAAAEKPSRATVPRLIRFPPSPLGCRPSG